MKILNKLLAYTTIFATICSSSLSAEESSPECAQESCEVVNPNEGCWGGTDGTAYAESCTSPCLTPVIALGVIAAIAIVAVVIQNNGDANTHAHSHN